jgi:acyl phosphate:glycerol-3-phosphate acyltransferase
VNVLLLAGTGVMAYALGCLNTGYYLVRARTGEDLRARGSGTAGATNTGRLLGRTGFLVAMVGDLLKGVVAVALARWAAGDPGAAIAAVGVVAGHVYPVQLGFRGGKGLATAFGAGTILAPLAGLAAVAVAAAMLGLSRRRVVSALTGVAAAPVTATAVYGVGPVALGLAALALVVLIRHAHSPAPRADPASPAAD